MGLGFERVYPFTLTALGPGLGVVRCGRQVVFDLAIVVTSSDQEWCDQLDDPGCAKKGNASAL